MCDPPPELAKQLEKDVVRTSTSSSTKLRQFLATAAAQRPERGYVQGMNNVAAFCLGVDDCVGTFLFVLSLVDDYYMPLFPGLTRDISVLEKLVTRYLPQCRKDLRASRAEPMTWAPRMLLPLFVDVLPDAVNLRVWDAMLSAGHRSVLVWTCLGILATAATEIHSAETFVAVQDAISNAAKTSTFDRLTHFAPCTIADVESAMMMQETRPEDDEENTPPPPPGILQQLRIVDETGFPFLTDVVPKTVQNLLFGDENYPTAFVEKELGITPHASTSSKKKRARTTPVILELTDRKKIRLRGVLLDSSPS